MKKFYILLASCTVLLTTCGCSNPFEKIYEDNSNVELIEIQNSDYTYTYKTPDGKIIFNNINEPLNFTNNIAVISKDGKYGLVNKLGEYVVEPIYDYIGEFHDGMCAFFIQDLGETVKIGYFNTKGEVVIDPIPADLALNSGYSYDYNFYNGVAMYRQPKTYKYGYINKSGEFIIEPMYTWAEPFKGNLAPVTKGNNYGYIDTSNNLVIPYKFVFADAFSDGLAAVYNGTSWGYIDESGNYVISPQFGSYEGGDGEEIAYPFIDGYAAVYLGKGQTLHSETHKRQFALIDKSGKILNNQKYDSLNLTYFEPEKPVYVAFLDDKILTLDTKGNLIKEEKY